MQADARRIQQISTNGGYIKISGAGALSSGDINGTVANQIVQPPAPSDGELNLNHLLAQFKATLETETALTRDLLAQLKAAIEADPNLNETDKTDALDEVVTLSKTDASPRTSAMKKAARNLIRILQAALAGPDYLT